MELPCVENAASYLVARVPDHLKRKILPSFSNGLEHRLLIGKHREVMSLECVTSHLQLHSASFLEFF